MREPLQWNWSLSGPEQTFLNEKILKLRESLEAALVNDADNELLQLRVMEARISARKFAEAGELGSRRPPGKAGTGFSSIAWDSSLAKALFALGRHDETLARISAVLDLEDRPELRRMRIETLINANRLEEAANELGSQRTDPDDVLSGPILNLALSQLGPEELLIRLDRRANTVRLGESAYTRMCCLLKLGRSGEVAAMVDLDRHVSERIMQPPGDWEQAPFLNALHSEISELDSFERDPRPYATYGGRQTVRTVENSPKAIGALIEQIRFEAERFCAALPDGDPLRASRPDRPAIVAWAVVLDQTGYQTPHLHAPGWLSGVYYVAAPDANLEAGALRVGLPPSPDDKMPWQVRHIVPEPGKLVLFPSFLKHDTLPHGGALPRICIAFDIVTQEYYDS